MVLFEVICETQWLRSMWMFVIIQREVEAFLIKYNFLSEQWGQYNRDKHSKNKPLNLKQPTVPRPPTVRNFTVVPLCRFQLKHIRIDHSDLYRITNDMGLIRRKMLSAKTGNLNKADDAYFRQYKEDLFGMMFNMKKIKRIAKKNKMNDFHFQVLTDGVSVSLLFKKPKQKIDNEAADQHLRDLYAEKRVKWEIGIDANVRTYLAVVARDVETGAEVSNKHFLLLDKIEADENNIFHWGTKQPQRDAKAERMTEQYVQMEQRDFAMHVIRPSPRGQQWRLYIQHRIRMLRSGMATYARRKYAWLILIITMKQTV